MRKFLSLLIITQLLFSCADNSNVQVLLITGGHVIDHEHFVGVFDGFDNVSYDELVQPEANQIYGSDSVDKYDVLVFYDMVQDITDEQKAAFTNMLNKGKGIVFLHHSIASYQGWDEYLKILGGRYHLDAWKNGSDSVQGSTYLHAQDVTAEIVDHNHPVTRGMDDFIIHDEVYDYIEILPDVNPLIITDHPESCDTLVWTNTYGNSRIVYVQSGHDNNAFSNPHYRQLLRQAINWVADY